MLCDVRRASLVDVDVARVLLVDDSASARALLGVRLREKAYDVVEVATAAEAAELAIDKQPDAVVTDLWMPGISGLQLCRLLRAEPVTAHVPVVLLTASDDRRSRFWARPAGAPDRIALSVSSDHPDAVAFVTRLYDQLGYDTVDNSPLRESWRTTPLTPAWNDHARQDRARLEANLRRATRVVRP